MTIGQKDKKTKGQKDKRTKVQKNKRTKVQKNQRTKGQKDKRGKGPKTKGQNILKKIFEVLCCILGMYTFLFKDKLFVRLLIGKISDEEREKERGTSL